jgi:hypothetical protein
MLKLLFTLLLGLIISSNCLAQFSPPGLGKANTASWFAIGLKQNLNESKSITSTSNFGLGRISNPNNFNLFQKQSIYVLNQEVSLHLITHWQYSLALSYRYQNIYQTAKPYELEIPNARQEIRIYNRYSYLNSTEAIDYSLDYRPEIRLFYNPGFISATENTQFRSRFRGKLSFNLNTQKTQRIITSAELLFSTSKTDSWSKFEYKEARFCLYYSASLPNQNIIFNLGYMNNLLAKSPITDVNYFAFDIEIKNLF